MTKEEAITNIEYLDWAFDLTDEHHKAIDMAIEALKILGDDGIVNCCGCIHWNEYGFCNLTDKLKGDFDYCSDGRREE